MIQVNRNKAEYKERIKEYYIEDVVDHAIDEYFDSVVVFNYSSLKDLKYRDKESIKTTKKHKVLETQAQLPFKSGDIVKVSGEIYEIFSVDERLPEEYRTLVNMNPKIADRYKIKVLVLYESWFTKTIWAIQNGSDKLYQG